MGAVDDTHKSRSVVQSESIIPCVCTQFERVRTCVTRIMQPFSERKTRVCMSRPIFFIQNIFLFFFFEFII